MTCGWQNVQKTVIAHSVARSFFLDCFAFYRIIRVVAGVTSGSNLRAGALRATAPYRKSELAMTIYSAALSLAALNDFVCESKRNEHPFGQSDAAGSAVYYCYFFFLPSFAVESSARNVQNGFTLSFGRERFHFFFFDAKEEKMNNKLHNLCMWSIDTH